MSTDDQLSRDLQSLRIDRGPLHGEPRIDRGEPTSAPRGAAGRRVVQVVGALLVVGLVLVGARAARTAASAQLFKTEVAFAQVGSLSPVQGAVEVTSSGYVVPQVVAKVGSKLTGRISKVGVREGAAVKAGDVLFELDPSEQRAAVNASQARVLSAAAKVEAARAQLQEVELQLARQEALAKTGAVPAANVADLAARVATAREQVKAQQAEVVAARADLAALAVGLASATVKAPIDGVAVTKPAELGDVVGPASTLVELVDFSSLLIETDVPEGRLGKVRPGGACEVALEAIARERFAGKVVSISPRLNRSKATAQVKVRLDAPPSDLRPEMAARVSFLSRPLAEAERTALPKTVVPAAAVVERGGAKVVFVLDGDRVRAAPVSLGEALGEDVELKSGPAPGTKVVRSPPQELRDGQSVKEKSQ
ncbi:MAG: efflux RND transporter periplasmic adaptor subunit [Myxococcales bacterium]|jgi:RND family efflux transporter MFP subunit|nr:efflux RND transporter periplasmic adaptor subunit [Myxococcales bacterium]HQY64429.1 efflux RND transporter periplasmic adaptor subunit [Polyangiaceae bacterium]